MRFTAYDVYEYDNNNWSRLDINGEEIYKALIQYPKVVEGKDSFAPLYIDKYREFVLGTLTQSYNTILTKFSEKVNTKQEVTLEDTEINDKTYFFINLKENRIYLQGRKYPGLLNKKCTIERLERIIGECLGKHVIFEQAVIKYTIDEIEEIFNNSFVKRISFKGLEGLKLPEDSVLHNPRVDLDSALVESYNVYSAPVLDMIELKAKNGEKLSKNPLAKIGMILSKVNKSQKIFRSMDIMDDGERVEIKPDGKEHKLVYVPKKDQDNAYETYERILKRTSSKYEERSMK